MIVPLVVSIILIVILSLFVFNDNDTPSPKPAPPPVEDPPPPVEEPSECLVLGNSYRVGPGKPCPKNVNKEDVDFCRNIIPKDCESSGRCRLINMSSKFQPDGLCIPSNKNEKRFCHDFSSEECPTDKGYCILKKNECLAPKKENCENLNMKDCREEKVCEDLNTIECMDSNMKNDRCTLFGHFCIKKIPK